MIPKRSELAQRYGDIDLNRIPAWINETACMAFLPVPTELQAFLLFQGKPVTRIYCNRDMAPALYKALGNILDRGLKSQVKEWGGCFMQRLTRGETTLSTHAYGLAIDLNPSTNQLGTEGDMSPELVKCFTDEGFIWGGTFTRCDPMHFQYVIE